jgi:hypothetical protein
MSENNPLRTPSTGSKTNKFNSAASAPGFEAGPEEKRAGLNYSNPRSLEPKNILALQGIIGNKAVQRMIAAQKGQRSQLSHQSQAPTTSHSASSPSGTIQRHASHEHKMLGDVNPSDLEIIASASNLNDKGKAVDSVSGAKLKITGNSPGAGTVITKDMVLHTLMQEINRIKFFRDHPPKMGEGGDTRASYAKNLKKMDRDSREGEVEKVNGKGTGSLERSESKDWQVVLVSIPSLKGGDPLMVTYGEMNTLADIYGNIDELKNADPKSRWEVIQGIRQLSLFNFMDIYDKVSGESSFSGKANPSRVGEGFDGATGVTGRGPNMVGELRFMMGGKKSTKGKAELDYTPGLGRNACHFAPESWYSWAKNHREALDFAEQAYGKKKQIQSIKIGLNSKKGQAPKDSQDKIKIAGAEKDQLENDALLANGFGDHFLQDSYAAGHLINKTQVMKWFVEWMDKHPFKADYTKDENWRRNQAIAYNQDEIGYEKDRYNVKNVGQEMLAKDPQSVENMEDDTTTNWQSRFKALGLKIPESVRPGSTYFEFTLWWQGRAANWYRTRGLNLSDVPTSKFSEAFARDGIKQLVKEGVARVNWTGSSHTDVGTWDTDEVKNHSYLLNPDYVPTDSKKFDKLVGQLTGPTKTLKQGSLKAAAEKKYTESATKVTYKHYHEFLGNSLLQAGTNILHNYFCNNGLEVETDEGAKLGRIYGDYQMLAKDSAVGVKYSSETAHMSRDSIIETYTRGKTDKTTDNIAKRFPTKAIDENGKTIGLDVWNQSLKKLLDTEVFAEAQSSLPARAGGIKGNSLGKISKDMDVHKGEAF